MFPAGTFDCAIRDRSDGLCAGVRQKTVSQSDAPVHGTTGHMPDPTKAGMGMAAPYDSCASLPAHSLSSSDSSPYDNYYAFGIDRLPSPGLSSNDLPLKGLPSRGSSTCASESDDLLKDEPEYLALRALYITDDSAFPDELPRDFFQRLAALVVDDTSDLADMRYTAKSLLLCSESSARSCFLQECIRDNTAAASRFWRALDVHDKQDLLLAYSCGPEELFRDFRNAA